MKRYPTFVAIALTMSVAAMVVRASPAVPDGYTIDSYEAGIGTAQAMAIGPDGLLYITDYLNGQLLRRTASGTLETVASGMPNATGVAFTFSGRLFVAGGTFYVYEIVGGTAQPLPNTFPYETSLVAKGDDLYVAFAGGISRISTITGAVTPVVTGSNVYGLSLDALGNLYYIDFGAGGLYTYNFVDPPRLLVSTPPSAGVWTGFGFDGQLLWSNYAAGTLNRVNAMGTSDVFATGFAGPGAPPAIGPLSIIAQGRDAILVADGHNIWRIALLPSADGVVHERGMKLRQTKNGWTLSCSVRYAAVNGSDNFHISFNAAGPGISAVPLDVNVGPTNRAFTLRVPGVQDSAINLSKKQLLIDHTVNLTAPPSRNSAFYCRGTVQDTTSGGYLRATLMEDIAQ